MDVADEVATATQSAFETTLDVVKVDLDFEHILTCKMTDVPAFSTLQGPQLEQFRALLENADVGARRETMAARKWLINPPDAVIVVVSLMRWKDERDSLEEYLEIIQRELKH